MPGDDVVGTSFVHRLDVRVKLISFAVLLGCTFLLRSPVSHLLVAILAGGLLVLIGGTARSLGATLLPLLPVVVCIVVFAAVGGAAGGDPTVVAHLLPSQGLAVTVGGLRHGVTLGLRLITMVSLTGVLVLSTPVAEFVALLRMLRLPFPVVFMVTTALRFVPALQLRSQQILDAQRARGASFSGGGLVGTIRSYTTIMVPLFSSALRQSEDLAAAMLARGYGVSKQPTQLVTLRMTWRDPLVVAVSVALLMGAVALRRAGCS